MCVLVVLCYSISGEHEKRRLDVRIRAYDLRLCTIDYVGLYNVTFKWVRLYELSHVNTTHSKYAVL